MPRRRRVESLEDGSFETPLVSEDAALVEPESVCEPIPLVAEVVALEPTAPDPEPDPDPEPVITEKRQPKVKPKRRTPRNIPRFVR